MDITTVRSLARARRNYFKAQWPKPIFGDFKYAENYPPEVAQCFLEDALRQLVLVRGEIQFLDDHPLRRQLFERIKSVTRGCYREEQIDEAEKSVQPSQQELEVMKEFVGLIRKESQLKRRIALLRRCVRESGVDNDE